ncbi:MAG: hypothetical protein ACFE7R_10875, partial [Candidatus Hodarchaeota archaeon]
AHAFTPFRAVFREGRYESLADCYGAETEHIHFIELGLSADSEIADHIPELHRMTFITSSDAHSPSPDKIGREFTRFKMDAPTYPELELAIARDKGRGPSLNVGFNPRLGKYYLSFCSSCRRTLIIQDGSLPPEFDEINIYISCSGEAGKKRLLQDIHKRKVKCPADGKSLRLGVRDRAAMIGEGKSRSPRHRPQYLYIPPLLDMLTAALNIKSKSSKRVRTLYNLLREAFGAETQILTDVPFDSLKTINEEVALMVQTYREGRVDYIAGGGGRYGSLIAPWEET